MNWTEKYVIKKNWKWIESKSELSVAFIDYRKIIKVAVLVISWIPLNQRNEESQWNNELKVSSVGWYSAGEGLPPADLTD